MPINFNTPCGETHLKKCDESTFFKVVSQHFHMHSIANDYFLEWHEAVDLEGRIEAWKCYRREMRRALAYGLTIDGVHTLTIHQASVSPTMWGFHVFLYLIAYLWMKR